MLVFNSSSARALAKEKQVYNQYNIIVKLMDQ